MFTVFKEREHVHLFTRRTLKKYFLKNIRKWFNSGRSLDVDNALIWVTNLLHCNTFLHRLIYETFDFDTLMQITFFAARHTQWKAIRRSIRLFYIVWYFWECKYWNSNNAATTFIYDLIDECEHFLVGFPMSVCGISFTNVIALVQVCKAGMGIGSWNIQT